MGKSITQLWDLAQKFGDAAQQVMSAFINDPDGFLSKVFGGLQQGFEGFFAELPQKLPDVLMSWLGSQFPGLKLPPAGTEWTVPVTVDVVLQLMKLDWDSVQQMLVRVVGADNVALAVKVFERVQTLLAGGAEGVYTLLDKAAGEIGYTADQLVKEVLAAATQVVTEKLPVAALAFVAKKLSLVPGVGAVLSLYDGLMWLLDPQTVEQIEKVVNPAIEGIKAVAQGNEQGQQLLANNVKEALLAGVPVALSFAVNQVPTLDKLPAAVRDALQSVSKTVEKKLTAWFETVKEKLAAPFKSRPGLIGEVQKFTVPVRRKPTSCG